MYAHGHRYTHETHIHVQRTADAHYSKPLFWKQPPSPCHSSTPACHCLTNSLLQLFVINYVFGRGVSLQETKILPQQSHNSVFSPAASPYCSCKHLCAIVSEWDSFWLIVLLKETWRPGSPRLSSRLQVTLSIFVPEDWMAGWIFPTPKCYETYSTHSSLLL